MKVFITQPLEQEAVDLLEAAGIEVTTSGVNRPLTLSLIHISEPTRPY